MDTKLKHMNKRFLKGVNLKKFSLFLIAAFILLMLSKLSESSLEYIRFDVEVQGLPKDVQLRLDSNTVVQARIKKEQEEIQSLSKETDKLLNQLDYKAS